MDYLIKITSWDVDKKQLSDIRRRVFIEEQKVPEELEWDEYDKDAIHIIVRDTHNQPIAAARMKTDGHIGRMAVLKACRNTGIGSAMLEALLLKAKETGTKSVYLHAQVSAIPFYKKHGFNVCSDLFMDAGIEHKTMRLVL